MPRPSLPTPLRAIIDVQAGVASSRQCAEAGLSIARQRTLLSQGHWRRLHPGVFVSYTGAVSDETRLWAALLAAGGDAAFCGETALWLADRRGPAPRPLQLSVGRHRKVVAPSGCVVRRNARSASFGAPARVAVEVATLQVVASARREDEVVSVVTRVIGGRLTTPPRLSACLEAERAIRWRGLLSVMLPATAMGAQSPLELLDLAIDQDHGLPVARRQVRHRAGGEGRWLDAVCRLPVSGPGSGAPRDLIVVKELDGRLGHEGVGRFRDMRRDNASALGGAVPLRFGWADEHGRPCETAAVQVLLWRRLGAPGIGHACRRAGCDLERRVRRLDAAHPALVA